MDDLRVRILNVRYREANRLRRLKRSRRLRPSEEAGNRNGKYSPHLETNRRRSVVSLGCISAGITWLWSGAMRPVVNGENCSFSPGTASAAGSEIPSGPV